MTIASSMPAATTIITHYSDGFTMLQRLLDYFEIEFITALRGVSMNELLSLLDKIRRGNALLVAELAVENNQLGQPVSPQDWRCIVVYGGELINIQCNHSDPEPRVAEAEIYELKITPLFKGANYPLTIDDSVTECSRILYLASLFFSVEYADNGLKCLSEKIREVSQLIENHVKATSKRERRTITRTLNSLLKAVENLKKNVEEGEWSKIPSQLDEVTALYSELIREVTRGHRAQYSD